jgi:hypothetical protein
MLHCPSFGHEGDDGGRYKLDTVGSRGWSSSSVMVAAAYAPGGSRGRDCGSPR